MPCSQHVEPEALRSSSVAGRRLPVAQWRGEESRHARLYGFLMPSLFRRHPLGRPPHPDVLTPAEWRVLDELRTGRSNVEIAERLGVSRNTVKTHVASIRAKLDVRDREALAGWGGQPAHVQRSPILAPLAWVAARGEAVVMSAVAAIVLAGVVIAMQAGVLTRSPDEAGVLPPATSTEAVPTSAAAPRPDCPVLDDVCALAVDLLPAMRTADGLRIAGLAERQQLTCPIFNDFGGGLEPLCAGRPSGHPLDVYVGTGLKGRYLLTDLDEFAVAVSTGLQAFGPPVRVVAVGCLSDDDGLRPNCARGAIAVYAGETPPLRPTPTPLPGGKPAESGFPEPSLTALVLSRNPTGQWHVETFTAPFQVPPNAAMDGLKAGVFADGAWREAALWAYEFK